MKTQITIKVLTLGLLMGTFSQAQVINNQAQTQNVTVNVIVKPRNAAETLRSLESQILTDNQVGDLLGTNRQSVPVSDIQLYTKINIPAAISSEGLPSAYDNKPIDSDELINSAYSSPELITKALDERVDYAMGERLDHFERQSIRIINVSANRKNEEFMRIALNRGVDLVHHILPSYGKNTDEAARHLANFYKQNFEFAASMANNSASMESILSGQIEMSTYTKTRSIAEFGRMYSNLLWRYSDGLSSQSSKAILLMRLIGYLGWDLNMDLKRNSKPIAKLIADVYELQHSKTYADILKSLKANKEPAAPAVSNLRYKVYKILEEVPARLREANVAPINRPRTELKTTESKSVQNSAQNTAETKTTADSTEKTEEVK